VKPRTDPLFRRVARELGSGRQEADLSVEDLARRAGVDAAAVRRLERAEDVPFSVVASVARVLGIAVELIPARRPRAPTGLPANLRGMARVLGRVLATSHDPLSRHAAGEIVVKLMDSDYGEGAVATVAKAVDEDVPSLYRYATVARCWDRRAVRALLAPPARTSRLGRVTWSHLVKLALLDDDKLRARWIERVRREHLSFRQLEQALTAAGLV
jgi:transcriptional regulator with XRE-family HTH domain